MPPTTASPSPKPRKRPCVSPERTEAVINWFAEHGPGTFRDLEAAFGWSGSYARFVCNTLRGEGTLRMVKKIPAKTRRLTLWDLT